MSIKYTNIYNCKALQKFTQIAIIGLKTYHLATLFEERAQWEETTRTDKRDGEKVRSRHKGIARERTEERKRGRDFEK
jgi:hypothetical protein